MIATKLRTVSATTSFASLEEIRCETVRLINNTGAVLNVRMRSEHQSGQSIVLANGQDVTLTVAQSSAEVQIQAASGAAGVQVICN
jgi:hypothetical protein